jgi:formate dehydrogenase subunit gamma
VAVVLIAIMIAHIYIGSLGMEGAYDAMGSGEWTLAWARTHHSLWVEEQQAKTASGTSPVGRPTPAE